MNRTVISGVPYFLLILSMLTGIGAYYFCYSGRVYVGFSVGLILLGLFLIVRPLFLMLRPRVVSYDNDFLYVTRGGRDFRVIPLDKIFQFYRINRNSRHISFFGKAAGTNNYRLRYYTEEGEKDYFIFEAAYNKSVLEGFRNQVSSKGHRLLTDYEPGIDEPFFF